MRRRREYDDDYDDESDDRRDRRRRRRRDDSDDGSEDEERDRRRRRRRYYDSDDDDNDRRRRRRRDHEERPSGGSTRIYVGNIPYSMTTDQLRDHFQGCGRVVDCIVKVDSATGRSRGFGIVQFELSSEAGRAIDRWHDRPYQSRPLVVRYDRESSGPPATSAYRAAPRGHDSGRGEPNKPPPSDAEIRKLLVEREKARIAKNYRAADDIRSDLADRGVTVNDINRTWQCVDGRSGDRPSAFDDGEGRATYNDKRTTNDDRAEDHDRRRRVQDGDDRQDKD